MNIDIILSVAFGAIITYIGILIQRKLEERDLKKKVLNALLDEAKINMQYLKMMKHQMLYEDSYNLAKSNGHLMLLSNELRQRLTTTYLLIKNRNEILKMRSYTIGFVEWNSFLITQATGEKVPFPQWLDEINKKIEETLPLLISLLNKELRG